MRCLFILSLSVLMLGASAQSSVTMLKLSSVVKESLVLAKANRYELEKVLSHYAIHKSDSLKFKAACFLIENMRWHSAPVIKTTVDPKFIGIFRMADSIYYQLIKGKTAFEIKTPAIDTAVKHMGKAMRDTILKCTFREPVVIKNTGLKSDLEITDASFLIKHIDHAFAVKRFSKWVQKLSFEEFCEHTLPYRIIERGGFRYSNEDFCLFFSKYLGDINNLDLPEIIERYNLTLLNLRRIMGNYLFQERLGFEEIFFNGPPDFDCFDIANYGFAILNACGVPINTEFNIAYAIFQNKHSDMTIPLSLGNWTPFTLQEQTLPVRKKNRFEEYAEYKERKRMNLYRIYFAAQKNCAYFLKAKNEYIPPQLSDPRMADATDLNLLTVSLKLPFPGKIANNLAYLATFNSVSGMVPVVWAKIDKQKGIVGYEKVIPNILYFPVYYLEDELQTFGRPFYLQQDSTSDKGYKILYVDDGKAAAEKMDMVLTRKFPEKPAMKRLSKELVGACVLGFDSLGGKPDTLFIVKEAPPPYLQDAKLSTARAYKYYQVRPALENTKLKMSEIYFLTDTIYGYSNTTAPPPLPVLHPDSVIKESRNLVRLLQDKLENLSRLLEYDGNMETVSRDSIVTMKLPSPQVVTVMRFAPQNANNGIVPEDEYLLKYWETGSWNEFDFARIAEYNYLEFKDVPKGKLYWLKNLTRGKEELPFTIDDKGRQQFLYFDLN